MSDPREVSPRGSRCQLMRERCELGQCCSFGPALPQQRSPASDADNLSLDTVLHTVGSTVAHMCMVHNVPIHHLRVLCCSTKHFDVLRHCHWKQCEEKSIFQHLSIADPKARCIKSCRGKQNPRTCLLHVSSSLQELEVVFYSKVRGYISSRPLCLGREREDFQPSSCENKVNALMLCLFCLPQ